MIDIRKVHSDFKGATAFKSNDIDKFMKWVPNKYCPFCMCVHDMITVNFPDLVEDNLIYWKEILKNHSTEGDSPENQRARNAKTIIDKTNANRWQLTYYCPYVSRVESGWPKEFYDLYCLNEQLVVDFQGPEKKHYLSLLYQINKRVAKREEEIIKLNNASPEIRKLLEELESLKEETKQMRDEIKKDYEYLKKKKTQVSDIIHNAAALRKQADDAISKNDVNWMRRFWDERY